MLAREQETIFRRSWQYVGHTGQLPKPASMFPSELAGLPVVVTRDHAGEIHALVNVCRHRGSIVCRSDAVRDTLQCPYHAWTYELDGSLRSAPRSDREIGFVTSDHSLAPLPVATWGPLVFAAATTEVPPFAKVLADLPDRLTDLGLVLEDLVFLKRFEGDYRANWKVCLENFLECYHCRVAHPRFSRVIDTGPDDYRLITAPTYSAQYGPVRANRSGSFDPSGPIERAQFHLLFPNTTINTMPGAPNLSIGPVIPLTAGQTHRFLDYFVAPEADEGWIAGLLAVDTQVGSEDVALVESVQRGMESGSLGAGTLFVDSEELIAHFDDWLRAALG